MDNACSDAFAHELLVELLRALLRRGVDNALHATERVQQALELVAILEDLRLQTD